MESVKFRPASRPPKAFGLHGISPAVAQRILRQERPHTRKSLSDLGWGNDPTDFLTTIDEGGPPCKARTQSRHGTLRGENSNAGRMVNIFPKRLEITIRNPSK
eukprot:931198_1